MGNSWRNASNFVKGLLVLQALIVVGLSLWIYNEYVSNPYLQTYLSSLLQGKGSLIAVIGFGGLLGSALVGIFLKAGNILRDIEHLSEKVENQSNVAQAVPEKTVPKPVLRVVDAQPVDEIGQFHSSLQRWYERSKSQE